MSLFTVTASARGGKGRARSAETLEQAFAIAAEFRAAYDGLCRESRVHIYKGEREASHTWRGSPDTGWYAVYTTHPGSES